MRLMPENFRVRDRTPSQHVCHGYAKVWRCAAVHLAVEGTPFKWFPCSNSGRRQCRLGGQHQPGVRLGGNQSSKSELFALPLHFMDTPPRPRIYRVASKDDEFWLPPPLWLLLPLLGRDHHLQIFPQILFSAKNFLKWRNQLLLNTP